MTARHDCSRRRFLTVLGAGSVAGIASGCSQDPAEPEQFGTVSAGNVADLPEGTLRAIDGAPAYIGRDADGVYAMTSTCTHEGCDMIAEGSVNASGVYCACHGSRFDANGSVQSGPADKPLAHFAVEIGDDGVITVHGESQVAASIRAVASSA
jgi:cytochrome b6-f complex iron-sulfur subunit